MNTQTALQKLNPWNWFKHEEPNASSATQIPVKRDALQRPMSSFDSPISDLHRQIDKLFDDTFKGIGFSNLPTTGFSSWPNDVDFRPSLNLASEDEKYTLTLEAPGIAEEDISIDVKDDILTIKGNKLEEKEDKDKHFYRMERRYGSFQRVLALPADVQVDDIHASMKNGLLTVSLPRNVHAQTDTKRIPISR